MTTIWPFLHGNGDVVHSHEHEHHHDHDHDHEHSHVPHEHHHHHEHRGLQEVIAIIDATDMSAAAKELALKIFDIIADAEAKAHAVEKNAVHFHEVGAIDSIVDIVAIAVCADSLGVENVIVPGAVRGPRHCALPAWRVAGACSGNRQILCSALALMYACCRCRENLLLRPVQLPLLR